MKVVELEIHNVRGIRDLSLRPNGRNCVVWGPNGSGKSAVVDAIDFLLTGGIARLRGRGTGGITLNQHGPHIDCKPADARVRAVVQLPGRAEPVELSRCMAQPKTLECDEKLLPYLEPVLALAGRGQHTLTRRDLLKFITAEAGTRAQEIQALLNVAEIEGIRKAFVKVHNDLRKDLQAAKRDLGKAQAGVSATVQEPSFRRDRVLAAVNRNRAVLGAPALAELHSGELKAGVTAPTMVSPPAGVNLSLLQKDLANLRRVVSDGSKAELARNDELLRRRIAEIRSDPQLRRDLERRQLIEMSIPLIDESGDCPLCEKPWDQGGLLEHLQERLAAAKAAAQQRHAVDEMAASIAAGADHAAVSVEQVAAAAETVGLEQEADQLRSWAAGLGRLRDALGSPIERYPSAGLTPDRVQQLLAPDGLEGILSRIETRAKEQHPDTTPELNAWDTLTRLEENLRLLEDAEIAFERVDLAFRRATILLQTFLEARDHVLGNLYDEIEDRFVELYRQLHGPEEADFAALIEPEAAGLTLQVDFHGRGTHPPHALHSEGHQDSMGICLYLALAERLTGGVIDLVLLDDVVMSVDAEHRRQVCHVLATGFPDRQFLITTHDRTWAHQLRAEGFVDSRGLVEFFNWDIDTGPRVCHEADVWDRIEADLQRGDVPSAAARLRRGAEEFFASVCDALQARVRYRLSGGWELGDLLSAAMGRYGELLKRAKSAAQSWGDTERFEDLREKDSIRKQVFTRLGDERWAVNANVHFNSWAGFTEPDFRPVVEAFHDLCDLFVCGNCGGMLRLAVVGPTATNVVCNCGKVNWSLEPKKKEN